jgi:hypothetical protein
MNARVTRRTNRFLMVKEMYVICRDLQNQERPIINHINHTTPDMLGKNIHISEAASWIS